MKKLFHLVHHTHWDREWYHTAEEFRLRLIPLIDEVIAEAERDPRFRFLLDGQSVVLDDYLAVRPERRAVLAKLINRGQIEAGPWYVLADELIPPGEALIRNLLAGSRTIASVASRTRRTKVLYCPDSFGHPATLPTLAAGFGCDLIILWRGFGGRQHPKSNCVVWDAPDGSSALLYHLARPGYELGSNLPTDPSTARTRWAEVRRLLTERDRIGVLLIPNGADHHALQAAHDQAVAALVAAAGDERVVRSSLHQFSRDVVAAAAQTKLPRVAGELRDSYGYTWTLQGTFATRSSLKRLMWQASRQLVREAEPWSALAGARGMAPDSLRDELNSAWRDLLLALPHDSICGCSIDEVATAARQRLLAVSRQARGLAERSIHALLGYDAVAVRANPGRKKRSEARDYLVVANPSPRSRSGVALVVSQGKLRDVKVGPGSAKQPPRLRGAPLPGGFVFQDGGREANLASQELSVSEESAMIESPRHYPDLDIVQERRSLVWIPEMTGYSTRILGSSGGRRGIQSRPKHPVSANIKRRSISNGLVSVGVDPATGRVFLQDASGKVRASIALEQQRDDGDLYTPSMRGSALVSAVPVRAEVVEKGSLRSTIEFAFEFSTAVENNVNRSNVTRRSRRNLPESAVVATPSAAVYHKVAVSVSASSPFVHVGITGNNSRQDNRLRLIMSGNFSPVASFADAPLGVVQRKLGFARPRAHSTEQILPSQPLHRHITIIGSESALTVLSDGTSEYEVVAPTRSSGRNGAVALTLVRSVGQLSKHDLPERPGNAGWPAATPEAQELGPYSANFAILPHASGVWDDIAGAVEGAAEDFLHPMHGFTLRSSPIDLREFQGVELIGEGLSVGSIKPSEDGRGIVLRCTNVTGRPVKGRWTFGFPIGKAWLARLDESPIRPIRVAGGQRVVFTAPPRATVTIRCLATQRSKRKSV